MFGASKACTGDKELNGVLWLSWVCSPDQGGQRESKRHRPAAKLRGPYPLEMLVFRGECSWFQGEGGIPDR